MSRKKRLWNWHYDTLLQFLLFYNLTSTALATTFKAADVLLFKLRQLTQVEVTFCLKSFPSSCKFKSDTEGINGQTTIQRCDGNKHSKHSSLKAKRSDIEHVLFVATVQRHLKHEFREGAGTHNSPVDT